MGDTIYALSSGRPPAGIAVIRISGPRAFEAAVTMAGPLPAARTTSLRTLRHPRTGEELDRGIVFVAAAPSTATGENIVEFHCHGGLATINAVLRALGELPQLRSAEPGEFTRQALANGRIDLTEAEGLADLLSAETELQRKVALRRSEGAVRRHLDRIRDEILSVAAQVEIAIDYVDEDDGGEAPFPMDAVAEVRRHIGELLARPPLERLRNGVRVVIAGPPNAGKSSLLNCLLGSKRAIVTDIAGTTRDSIEVPLEIGGSPMVLIDTAGLRESDEIVETLGIERARRELETADIILWLGPPTECPDGAILIHAKADLGEVRPGLKISARTGEGREKVLSSLAETAAGLLPTSDSVSLTTHEREGLTIADSLLGDVTERQPLEINADHLRRACHALDRTMGRVGVEDMLDTLFARFCVGK